MSNNPDSLDYVGPGMTDAQKDRSIARAQEEARAQERARLSRIPSGPPQPSFTRRFPWLEFYRILEDPKSIPEDLRTLIGESDANVDVKETNEPHAGKSPVEIADEAGRKDLGDVIEEFLPKGGRRKRRSSRKSRLNVKRRGTKRHGRSGKHRKLRKLATRRR